MNYSDIFHKHMKKYWERIREHEDFKNYQESLDSLDDYKPPEPETLHKHNLKQEKENK